jgi:hypothetical protein
VDLIQKALAEAEKVSPTPTETDEIKRWRNAARAKLKDVLGLDATPSKWTYSEISNRLVAVVPIPEGTLQVVYAPTSDELGLVQIGTAGTHHMIDDMAEFGILLRELGEQAFITPVLPAGAVIT